jgi:uncharacterized protein
MHVSTYTMRFKIETEGSRLLYNPLTGSMDLVEPSHLRTLDAIRAGHSAALTPSVQDYFLKRGYIYNSADDEAAALRAGYDKFAGLDERTALRFFIVPTYNCNAKCPYCFVHELIGQEPVIDEDTIAAAFQAMDQIVEKVGHKGVTQLIFFGGEPFIASPGQMVAVESILKQARKRDFLIDAVTNGLDLAQYAELLSRYGFNKAQVTFDGMEDYCNKRRPAVDEKGKTFRRLEAGIDKALEAGLQVNARILLDKTSIHTLPEIVDFFDGKGWFYHENFGSHIGSTYDCFDNLHEKEKQRFLNFHEGNELLVEICRQKPYVADKIKIDWHGARQFLNTGLLPPPNFKSCLGATKTYAFDLHGDIFLCESTVGKQDCRIGQFLPALSWNESIMAYFEQRSLLTLDTCKSCSQALLCAGGCPFTGQVKGKSLEDLGCRGMKETLEYGLNYYWPRIKERMVDTRPDDDASGACGCTS